MRRTTIRRHLFWSRQMLLYLEYSMVGKRWCALKKLSAISNNTYRNVDNMLRERSA